MSVSGTLAVEVSPNETPPLLETRRLCRHFGGVEAVRDVSVTIGRGEVRGLVGENGAGKSTFARMIAGAISPSDGEIVLGGEAVEHHSPRHAQANGVTMIEQELSLVPTRSVVDNVFLGIESRRARVHSRRRQRKRYEELVARTGFKLAADTPVGALGLADMQKVEILRALARDARLIVMDEPTAPLTADESKQLYQLIRDLQAQGTTVIFITHYLDEVLEVADNVTIMRDGAVVRTRPVSAETEASLVEGMVGRSVELAFPESRLPHGEGVRLEVRNLTRAGAIADVSFTLRAGEILGVAGLVGSGRTELARAIFGADRVDGGEILVDGERLRRHSPAAAIGRGIVMLPEGRKDDGLVMARSVSENLVLAKLSTVSSGGVVLRRREREQAQGLMRRLSIRCEGPRAPVETLSGGNQQKVLFGKCLMCEPRVFIVDEPTRGVDVGSRRAIYDLIRGLAAKGMAVLFISSELEEVLALGHRVMVMRKGRVAAMLAAEEADEHTVLAAAFGTQRSHEP